jgi:hypothetical protein
MVDFSILYHNEVPVFLRIRSGKKIVSTTDIYFTEAVNVLEVKELLLHYGAIEGAANSLSLTDYMIHNMNL